MTDESVLIECARNGDLAAFGRLVEQYQRPVFSLAYRMLGSALDAEDAAQESFFRAYRALSKYDSSRAFSTWLLSIAAHHCIDRIRRRRILQIPIDKVPHGLMQGSTETGPERSAERAHEAARVQAVLAELPEDYRVIVVLRYWHDLGYSEIAEVLGESESAVKSRLHRARLKLAELLCAADQVEPKRPPRSAERTRTSAADGGKVKSCSANAPVS